MLPIRMMATLPGFTLDRGTGKLTPIAGFSICLRDVPGLDNRSQGALTLTAQATQLLRRRAFPEQSTFIRRIISFGAALRSRTQLQEFRAFYV